jgi:hypothetical protein
MKSVVSIGSFCSAVLLILLTGCGRYVSVTTETHPIPANSTVTVSTFNGSISVEWYEGTEMLLEITRTSSRSEDELDKVEVEITSGEAFQCPAATWFMLRLQTEASPERS